MHFFLHSAFLPADVSELKKVNVDVNPEYSESLDVETFAMHLMFEPVDARKSPNKKRSMLEPLFMYPSRAKEAFEAGLDEVSCNSDCVFGINFSVYALRFRSITS
jgi:hypothetical protein